MKICPSCNARVSKGAEECRSCGHRWGVGGAKQTMMGLPALYFDDEPEGSPVEQGGREARKTQFGLPSVSWERPGDDDDDEAKTEVVAADEIFLGSEVFDIDLGDEESEAATEQIGTESLAHLLGPKQGPRATAFGLPSPFMAAEPDEAGAISAWGLAAESEGDDDATQVSGLESPFPTGGVEGGSEGPQQRRDHRTLMGMSVMESFDGVPAGAMVPTSGSTESDDAPTRVVGPGVFEHFEGGFPEFDSEEAPSSGPYDVMSPEDEESATVVVSDIPDLSDFELPSLGGEETVAELYGESPRTYEAAQALESGRSARELHPFRREDVPQSGVFRVPKRRSSEVSTDSGALGGTGTYRVGQGESSSQTESPFDLKLSGREEGDISGGLIGGGKGRTSFPTGGSRGRAPSGPAPSGPAKMKGSGRRDTSRGRPIREEPSSGPRFSVGSDKIKQGAPPQRTLAGIKPIFSTGPTPAGGEERGVGQSAAPPLSGHGPAFSTGTAPGVGAVGAASQSGSSPAQVSSDGAAVPQEAPRQIIAPELDLSAAPPSFGAEIAPAEPSWPPRGEQGGGGGQGFGGAPSFGAEPQPLQPQPGVMAQEQVAAGQLGEMVALLQKMLAIVAALLLMGATVAALLISDGVESAGLLAAILAPAILAIVAVLVAALPRSETGRSVGLGVVAVLALISCAMAFVMGIGPVAGIGQIVGGLVLGGAAALPKLKGSQAK